MPHPKNKTRYKVLDRIAADPRVKEIWEEGSDGIWCSLAPGYNHEGCSGLHEWGAKKFVEHFRNAIIEEGDPY